MQIVKEKLEIDEMLEKKINSLLKFNNIKALLEIGSIITLTNTNIEIKEVTYFFFNECESVYVNDLKRFIPLKELEYFIKCIF